MLWGPPGIGKSTIIREITEEMGIGFIDVRLAQREPVDIRGLPRSQERWDGGRLDGFQRMAEIRCRRGP